MKTDDPRPYILDPRSDLGILRHRTLSKVSIMALSTNIGAYKDCEDYFAQALEATKGIAIVVDTPGMAKRTMQRLNQYRVLLRKQSEEIYSPGHASRGKSIYDGLSVRQDPNNHSRVMIVPFMPAKVEEL